jgi:hypothetical protein
MTHDQVKILLNDFFDEKLSVETNRSIEIHLSECQECSQYLFSLQDLMKHADKLPRKIKPNVEFWNDIFGAISSIKTENIRQKEEIDLIEAERLLKQEEALIKEDKKRLKAEKLLKNERRKATFIDLVNKPVYRYSLIGIVCIVIFYFIYNFIFTRSEAWEVSKLKFESTNAEPYAVLSDYDFVETGVYDRLEILVPEVGNILLEPNTKIQRLSSNSFLLLKGEITAIKDGAKEFLNVLVPGASIKDFFLGGQYKLSLSNSNLAKLEVIDGWVSVNQGNLESRVLPNHICEVTADSGMGLPFVNYSSIEFISAANRYCFSNNSSEENLISLLSKADASNAVSLWNLMWRTSLKQREIVMFTMFNLVGRPSDITDEGLKMLKKPMMQKFLEDIETKI